MPQVPQDMAKVYASEDHYFPERSLMCVKCGCSHSAARGQPCISVRPAAVMI